MLIFWVLGFSLLGSIGSIAGAALLLVFPDAVRRKFVPCLISYASGTLIGAAFLGMIPSNIKALQSVMLWQQCFLDWFYSSFWRNS